MHSLAITSPKRKRCGRSSWNEFFPYYAGFSEQFAKNIIESAKLERDKTIIDPWNGSGTTTYAASQLGYNSIGVDLNPVMVLIARARTLAPSEADSIEPQAKSLAQSITRHTGRAAPDDPLLQWFSIDTATTLRKLERRIRTRLIGKASDGDESQFETISCFAATFYVALFTVCRNFTKPFASTNPTWLRTPKATEEKITIPSREVAEAFIRQATSMAASLKAQMPRTGDNIWAKISVGNSTQLKEESVADLILTSPPYCTRIDYTAATRVELAVIAPLIEITRDTLSKEMIGSVKVPTVEIKPKEIWGETCLAFLDGLASHSSKASAGYYFKTHLDYFDKMSRSIQNISHCLKSGAGAVLVVQDSYYKEIHNNLPLILTEMAERTGLTFIQREDFIQGNTLGRINPRSRRYRESTGVTEAVICLKKN